MARDFFHARETDRPRGRLTTHSDAPYCIANGRRKEFIAASHRLPKVLPVRVLISGSTGMIGSALASRLRQQGYDIAALIRPGTHVQTAGSGAAKATQPVHWDPVAGTLDRS